MARLEIKACFPINRHPKAMKWKITQRIETVMYKRIIIINVN